MEDPTNGGKLCGSRKKSHRGAGHCRMPAGYGTNHPGIGKCKFHMGATRAHTAAAQKVVAARAVETFGLARDIDPRDALLEEVHRTAGVVDWLRQRVQELDPEQVVWGTVEIRQGDEDTEVQRAEVNTWVELYQKERRHLVAVCKEAITAGIEQRRVELAEQQGMMIAGAIRAILAELELTPQQDALVVDVVPRHLRALAVS